jgi:hypothetical protein
LDPRDIRLAVAERLELNDSLFGQLTEGVRLAGWSPGYFVAHYAGRKRRDRIPRVEVPL